MKLKCVISTGTIYEEIDTKEKRLFDRDNYEQFKHSIGCCETRGSILLEVAHSAGPSSQKTIGKAVAVDDDNAYDAGNDDVGVINYCEVGGDNNENDEYDDVVLTSTSMNHRSYQL